MNFQGVSLLIGVICAILDASLFSLKLAEILYSKYKEAFLRMAGIYPNWHKTVARVGLTSLFSMALYGFSSLATAQTIKLHQPQFSNQKENLLKCGWQKEVKLKLPLWHLLAKSPGKVGKRAESNTTRCGISLPIYLTALIPQSNIGVTVFKYPTFFFYIPDANLEGVKRAELVLFNNKEEVVYEKTVKLKSPDSIVSIDLSDSPALPPLEVGKSYQWIFSVIFDEEDMSDSAVVAGWIKRVSVDSKLQYKLDTGLPQEKPAIYASNGYWFDALASLAKLRCSYPNDKTFSSDWESLLQQVGLPEIAIKPLAQCN